MPAAELDIVIEIGAQFELDVEYERDGDPVDLVGDAYEAELQVRTSYDSDPPILALSVGDGLTLSSGLIAIAVPGLDTAELDPQNAVWDLKVLPGGIQDLAKRLVQGRAIISPAATR